jgi:hypothetical protein
MADVSTFELDFLYFLSLYYEIVSVYVYIIHEITELWKSVRGYFSHTACVGWSTVKPLFNELLED